MIAADTSVVIAGFATWHESHASASQALSNRVHLPAHVILETYSVLTRLPPPHRAAPDVVQKFLSARFPDAPLTLPGRAHQLLLERAVEDEILGGAVYDALVAATALHARAKLLTRDRRAVSVYESVGVRFELVS